jgi:hypothetical protein
MSDGNKDACNSYSPLATRVLPPWAWWGFLVLKKTFSKFQVWPIPTIWFNRVLKRNPWSQTSSHKPMPWGGSLDACLQSLIIKHKPTEVIDHVTKVNPFCKEQRCHDKFLQLHRHEIPHKHNISTFQVQSMAFWLTGLNEAIWGTWVFLRNVMPL